MQRDEEDNCEVVSVECDWSNGPSCTQLDSLLAEVTAGIQYTKVKNSIRQSPTQQDPKLPLPQPIEYVSSASSVAAAGVGGGANIWNVSRYRIQKDQQRETTSPQTSTRDSTGNIWSVSRPANSGGYSIVAPPDKKNWRTTTKSALLHDDYNKYGEPARIGGLRRNFAPPQISPPNSPNGVILWNIPRPVSSSSSVKCEDCGWILPGDILQYVLSFLWPIRELYSCRLARKCIKNAADSLTVNCSFCHEAVNWQNGLVCDSCYVTSCRRCADLQLMPKDFTVRCFNVTTCHSCKGRMQPEWETCPWCGTHRPIGIHRSLRLLPRKKIRRPTRAWVPHPCGHSMLMRRTCRHCIMTCTWCRGVACEKCIWHDGSRSACFGCTIAYGR